MLFNTYFLTNLSLRVATTRQWQQFQSYLHFLNFYHRIQQHGSEIEADGD